MGNSHLFGRSSSFFLLLALAIVLLSASAHAETPADVPIIGYVNDHAGILTTSQIQDLNNQLSALDHAGIAQIAVVTVHNLNGEDIQSFALQLDQGVLGDKSKNNGLLFLIAVDDRKYWFDVGRGLEADLNDAKVGRIGRAYVVSAFQQGKYSEGIFNAIYAIEAVLKNETNSSYYSAADSGISSSGSDLAPLVAPLFLPFFVSLLVVFVVIIMISIVVGMRVARAAKSVKGKKNKDKEDKYFLGALILSSMMRGGRGGGGFGGGGFGGGGFSGGGGSFGGGGAGGGW